MFKTKQISAASLALLLATTAPRASAAQMVTNGGFETLTNGTGQLGFNTNATGWNTTGYNFIFGSGAADTSGSIGAYGTLKLWGPHSGSANGLPAASPAGGNFVAADGAFGVQPIQQTIAGLTVGKAYNLGFYWAGAQQLNYDGRTTEQWKVSLGTETHSTAMANNSSNGFTGWMHESMSFTATASSQVLSFLAVGTPNGLPPFSLLDGVSMTDVPEPASLALLGAGLLGLACRRRRAA